MKYADCNARQKKAFKNIYHACNWFLGGLENTMLDNKVLLTYITDVLGGVIGEEHENPYGQGRIVAVEEAPAE